MTLKEINNILKQHNGKIYIVGGAVRDKLLSISCHDVDVVVVGIEQTIFEKLFPEAKMTGKSFPVYRMDVDNFGEVEFAFARKERKIASGHNGFEVVFDPSVTLKEDLYRRDLTMNALAEDVDTHEIIDYFHGIEDINNKRICAVSEHFLEDPLRALRAARQSAKFNFKINDYTFDMMNKCKEELKEMSQDRIVEELKKALATDKPSIFFEALKIANILDVCFPFIYRLIGQTHSEKFHPEGDAYNHTMKILDDVSQATSDITTRFAALMHDVGKGLTPKEELPHHFMHDIRGANIVNDLPSAYPNEWKKAAAITCSSHMKVAKMKKHAKIVDLLVKIKRNGFDIDKIALIVKNDGQNVPWFLNKEIQSKICDTKIQIPSSMKEGKKIKDYVRNERIKILKALECILLDM